MASDYEDFVQDEITEWAQNVVDAIRANLVRKDSWYDDSELAQSITPKVTAVDGGYQIVIEMNNYWEFIDKGRRPTRASGNGSVRKNLLLWISKRGIAPQLKQVMIDKKTGKSFTRTFKNTLQWRDSLSYAISSKIHKKGFVAKGKGFFSEVWNEDSINELLQTLLTKSGEVFVAEILEE